MPVLISSHLGVLANTCAPCVACTNLAGLLLLGAWAATLVSTDPAKAKESTQNHSQNQLTTMNLEIEQGLWNNSNHDHSNSSSSSFATNDCKNAIMQKVTPKKVNHNDNKEATITTERITGASMESCSPLHKSDTKSKRGAESTQSRKSSSNDKETTRSALHDSAKNQSLPLRKKAADPPGVLAEELSEKQTKKQQAKRHCKSSSEEKCRRRSSTIITPRTSPKKKAVKHPAGIASSISSGSTASSDEPETSHSARTKRNKTRLASHSESRQMKKDHHRPSVKVVASSTSEKALSRNRRKSKCWSPSHLGLMLESDIKDSDDERSIISWSRGVAKHTPATTGSVQTATTQSSATCESSLILSNPCILGQPQHENGRIGEHTHSSSPPTDDVGRSHSQKQSSPMSHNSNSPSRRSFLVRTASSSRRSSSFLTKSSRNLVLEAALSRCGDQGESRDRSPPPSNLNDAADRRSLMLMRGNFEVSDCSSSPKKIAAERHSICRMRSNRNLTVDRHIASTPLTVVGSSTPIKPLIRKTTASAVAPENPFRSRSFVVNSRPPSMPLTMMGSSRPIKPLTRKSINAAVAPENPFRLALTKDDEDSLVELDSDVSDFEEPGFSDSWTHGFPGNDGNIQTEPELHLGMSFADLAVRPRNLDALGVSFADLAARPGSGLAIPGTKATDFAWRPPRD